MCRCNYHCYCHPHLLPPLLLPLPPNRLLLLPHAHKPKVPPPHLSLPPLLLPHSHNPPVPPTHLLPLPLLPPSHLLLLLLLSLLPPTPMVAQVQLLLLLFLLPPTHIIATATHPLLQPLLL